MRWMLVGLVLICCAGVVGTTGAEDGIPREFMLFSDAGPLDVVSQQPPVGEIDPAFNLFSDAPPVVGSSSEIEVEIWVRDQCTYCDAWYQSLKADSAKRRSSTSDAPRIKWIVRTDAPPAGARSLPYSRFTVAGQTLEKSGLVTPDGVIQDWLKWSRSFRQ